MLRSCLKAKQYVKPDVELEPMPTAAELAYDAANPLYISFPRIVHPGNKSEFYYATDQLAASAEFWEKQCGPKRARDSSSRCVTIHPTARVRFFGVYDASTATLVEEEELIPDAQTSEVRQAAGYVLLKMHRHLVTLNRSTGERTYTAIKDNHLEDMIHEHAALFPDIPLTKMLGRALTQIDEELLPHFERRIPFMGEHKKVFDALIEAEKNRDKLDEYLNHFIDLTANTPATMLRGVPVHGFYYGEPTETALRQMSRVLRGMVDV